ncbi:hypothetical protein MKX78_10745 [Cytobacillus sp. FSL R5-0569]|uniref:hypothetical protein n=1 Tax=Cytobacillus sp. FSL R5-0569 TaxID=2921649 RepID=UPI0030FA5E56
MSVNIRGNTRIIKEIQQKLNGSEFKRISDKALLRGAQVFVRELRRQFESFEDKGESIKEITIGDPEIKNGERTIKVLWRGEHDRYRIIHLNEWGTIKNPNPRGKGAVARALKLSEKAYSKVIKEELKKGL